MNNKPLVPTITPLKAVYCYYFPETRKIIDEVVHDYPHETFLQSITPGLDDFHHHVIDSYLNHFSFELPELPSFPFRYVAGGASESIFHLLSYINAFRSNTPLYVLRGEYEGFAGYGANLGLSFTEVENLDSLLSLPQGILFLSNPSARDGNIIPNQEIIKVADSGHQIIYDLTYVGLTDPHYFQLNHPNIIAAIVSLSKPFGLYYYRVGFAFSRFEIKTLEVNKWFKNIFSLIVADKILNQIDSKQMLTHYRLLQNQAIKKMKIHLNLDAIPSDVFLLAHSPSIPDSSLKIFNRRSNYRFCLTPYYLFEERGLV